jgi:hypothetical protein
VVELDEEEYVRVEVEEDWIYQEEYVPPDDEEEWQGCGD